MNVKKLLLATIVVGIVANVWDYVVHELILTGAYYSKHPALFNANPPMGWFIFGDFVWALVFVWVYDRVYGSFGGGTKGGTTYGFYAGVLLSFPYALFNAGIYVDFPYALAWIWVVTGIIFCVIAGAVAGALYSKGAPTPAA